MKARQLVLIPLLVMVLLTLLVGGTAYQQTLAWEKGVETVINDVSRIVLLSNIRSGLRTVQKETDPALAHQAWQDVQHNVLALAKAQPRHANALPSPLPDNLQLILKTSEPSPPQVTALLQSDLFFSSLQDMDELARLKNEAQRVTVLMTISMFVLGLILTGITAYDLERLFMQLARSRDLNIKLQEEERRRIAQDLHDGVVQELIDLKRHYQPEKVDVVVANLRRVCHNLKPQVLEDLGLPAALSFLADDLRQSGMADIRLTIDEAGLLTLPKHYELPLFRVIQELCSNIKHHANASKALITIAYNPMESPTLRGYVSDNGIGFDPTLPKTESLGLTGVQERLQQVGGSLTITSQPGQGSKFQFSIPIQHAH